MKGFERCKLTQIYGGFQGASWPFNRPSFVVEVEAAVSLEMLMNFYHKFNLSITVSSFEDLGWLATASY